ncbi:MAG: hypothetical protein M2R45_01254 [Verrucomicrobia subdivision 3 bacterium]|nr:hypothetical protein [Limisphaerales bacterium]MCS1415125.1 hypothetical protein [Limisphaerales bacterium]
MARGHVLLLTCTLAEGLAAHGVFTAEDDPEERRDSEAKAMGEAIRAQELWVRWGLV